MSTDHVSKAGSAKREYLSAPLQYTCKGQDTTQKPFQTSIVSSGTSGPFCGLSLPYFV